MARPSIKKCRSQGLHDLTQAMHYGSPDGDSGKRKALILVAGAVNNTALLKQLGSQESSTWYEGRRMADPEFRNPYWPDRG